MDETDAEGIDAELGERLPDVTHDSIEELVRSHDTVLDNAVRRLMAESNADVFAAHSSSL